MTLYLKTMGTLSLSRGGCSGDVLVRGGKGLAVLAYLASRPDGTAQRDHLAEVLWPQEPSDRARRALRQAIYHVNRQAGCRLIDSSNDRLRVRTSEVEVDFLMFDRLLKQERFDEAINLYDGPFLAGMEETGDREFSVWVESRNERLRSGLRAAYIRMMETAEASGRIDEAVELGNALVDLNPLEPTARLRLVRNLLHSSDAAGAYQVYESYRVLLQSELDEEPEEALEKRIAPIRDELYDPRPTAEPDPGPDPDPVSPQWGVRALVGLSVAALLLAFVVREGPSSGDAPSRTVWDELDVVLFVKWEVGGSRFGRVEVQGRNVRIRDLDRFALTGEGGRLRAFSRSTNRGPKVVVEDQQSGDTRILTETSRDERAEDWSPDSRQLLVQYGEALNDTLYRRAYAIYDLEGEKPRDLNEGRFSRESGGRWSPTGTRIAFAGTRDGESEVYVVDVDGRDLVNLSTSSAPDSQPAWSPSGRRIAFTSWRKGSADIFVVDVEGENLDRVTFDNTAETEPVWLSETVLGFVRETEDRRDLWAIDLVSRETKRLTESGEEIVKILDVARRRAGAGYLEDVAVAPDPGILHPGQVIQLEARRRFSSGERDTDGGSVRWTVGDTLIANVSPAGVLQARRPGSTIVAVSAGGWRTDTLRLTVLPLEIRDAEMLVREDWKNGIDPSRWYRRGTPLPRVIDHSEGDVPWERVFLNNGDQNHSSGVVSVESFSLEEGLTVEWWARIPFTEALHEDLIVDFLVTVPEQRGGWPDGNTPGLPRVSADEVSESMKIQLDGTTIGELPIEDPGAWHLYTLQMSQAGTVGYLVDGQMKWKSNRESERARPEQRNVHVVIAGRSLGSKILVGPVYVYRGARYGPAR